MASIEGTYEVKNWTQALVALTPSMRTLAALLPVPLAVMRIDFDGLLVPPLVARGGANPGTMASAPP